MANLTDKQKTLPLVKVVRQALPALNSAFHEVCSKYTFGDIVIEDVSPDGKQVDLSCSMRDFMEPLRIRFDGHQMFFPYISYGFPMRLDSHKGALLKLQARSGGTALAYVIKGCSLFMFATQHFAIQEVNDWMMHPVVSSLASSNASTYAKFALSRSPNRSITFFNNTIVFCGAMNHCKVIDISCAALAKIDLATYRKNIREAFTDASI